jgi:fructose/tagatose bisphosphate aldolase
MEIIAVNINKALASRASALNATKEAWKINQLKFINKNVKFVIGVASGQIHGYYKLKTVRSAGLPNRVKFLLKKCSGKEISKIDAFTKGKNLKYFVTKYNW